MYRIGCLGPPVLVDALVRKVRLMMSTPVLRLLAASLASTVFFAAGCNSAASDWSKAKADNTVAAYQSFLAAHPNDEHAAEAKSTISSLEDGDAWTGAQHANTVMAYQAYLDKFPQGSNAAAARDAITGLKRAEAWKAAQSGTVAALRSFVQEYPTGPEAALAKTQIDKLSAYHVQLAKESTDARAQKRLARLKAQLDQQVPGLKVSAPTSGKSSFSIESDGMTQDDATALCKTLEKNRHNCEVVKE
jgi:DNA polymerase III delta prime subunit